MGKVDDLRALRERQVTARATPSVTARPASVTPSVTSAPVKKVAGGGERTARWYRAHRAERAVYMREDRRRKGKT